MFSKILIVHGANRREAIKRMEKALKEFVIKGIKTTIPFHLEVLSDSNFQKGEYTTKFVEEKFLKG